MLKFLAGGSLEIIGTRKEEFGGMCLHFTVLLLWNFKQVTIL